jgi:hypothetical protein
MGYFKHSSVTNYTFSKQLQQFVVMLFDLKDLRNKKPKTRDEEILELCLLASLVSQVFSSISSASNYVIENGASAGTAKSRRRR